MRVRSSSARSDRSVAVPVNPNRMFCSTVSHGSSRCSWKTIPHSVLGRVTSRSPTRTLPVCWVSRPAMQRSTVDLPQPEGPMRATNSPAAT